MHFILALVRYDRFPAFCGVSVYHSTALIAHREKNEDDSVSRMSTMSNNNIKKLHYISYIFLHQKFAESLAVLRRTGMLFIIIILVLNITFVHTVFSLLCHTPKSSPTLRQKNGLGFTIHTLNRYNYLQEYYITIWYKDDMIGKHLWS